MVEGVSQISVVLKGPSPPVEKDRVDFLSLGAVRKMMRDTAQCSKCLNSLVVTVL